MLALECAGKTERTQDYGMLVVMLTGMLSPALVTFIFSGAM